MLVPKLRFKGYQAPWYNLLIKDIMKITSGQGFKASEYALSDKENQIRLLQIENIKYGTIQWGANTAYLPIDYLDKYSHLVLRKGDIVLALNRPVTNNQLKIAILTSNDSPSILYQRVGRCDFLRNENNYFYFYLLQKELKNFVVKQSIGSDQPFISLSALYKHQVITTQKSEQNKITDFLSSFDQKIALQSRKVELLQQYKKGMIQKLFSQEIRFKNDDSNFYSNWETTTLGKIANFHKGKGISKQDVTTKGENECIRYGELYTHYNEKINCILSKTNISSSESFISHYGDILIPSSGETAEDISKASSVLINGVLLGGDLNIIRLKNDYNSLLLAYYLTHYKKKEISQLAQGNSVVHLYAKELKSLEITLPSSLDEQDKIANLLSSIDDKITFENTKLDKLKQWKQGLLQQMFV